MTARAPLVVIAGSPNKVNELSTGDTLTSAAFGITGAVVGTTDTQTLTNKTITAGRFDALWFGTSPSATLKITGVALAANWFEITNNTAGVAPRLRVAVGSSDANVNIVLEPKGTGVVQARYAGVSHELATTDTAQTFSAKSLATPAIGDYTLAQHNHQSASGGGLLTSASFALGSGLHRTLLNAAADSSAIANVAVATAFDNAKITTTLNTIASVGAVLRMTFCGKFSTVAAPNLTFSLRDSLGNIYATTAGIVTPAGAVNELWSISFLLTCRATGAGGSISTACPQEVVAGASRTRLIATTLAFNFATSGNTSIALGLWATWGVANPANTITCEAALMEALN